MTQMVNFSYEIKFFVLEYKMLVEKTRKLKYEQFRKVIDMLRCLFDIPVKIKIILKMNLKILGYYPFHDFRQNSF